MLSLIPLGTNTLILGGLMGKKGGENGGGGPAFCFDRFLKIGQSRITLRPHKDQHICFSENTITEHLFHLELI